MADNNLLLEGGKSFVKKYSQLSAADQATVLNSKDIRDFQRIAGPGAQSLYEDLQAYKQLSSQGVHLELPHASPLPVQPAKSLGEGAISSALAGGALGVASLIPTKRNSYSNFIKDTDKYLEEVGKDYDKETEDLKRHPKKKPDPSRPATKEEAIERARASTYDYIAYTQTSKAKEWFKDNQDNDHLAQALDRNELGRKDLSYEEFKEIRERYIERAGKNGNSPEAIQALKNRANNEFNDVLNSRNPDLAKEWATKKGDAGLVGSLNRKRERDIEEAKKSQGRVSKLLRRDPAKKFGPEIVVEEVEESTPATYVKPIAPAPIPSTPRPAPAPAPTASAAAPRRTGRAPKQSGTSGAVNKARKARRLYLLLSNPWVAGSLILGIVLLLLVAVVVYAYSQACTIAAQYPFGQDLLRVFTGINCENGSTADSDTIPPPPPGFTIEKRAVDADGNTITTIGNNVPIRFEIKITYDPSKSDGTPLSQMTLIDRPDFNHTISSVADAHTTDGAVPNQNIQWKISDFINSTRLQWVFRLTLLPSVSDLIVTNNAWIDTPTSGGTPKPCVGDPAVCLKDEFNFIVQGNPPQAKLLDVYNIFSEVAVAQKYKNLLYTSGPTDLIFADGTDGGCPARVEPGKFTLTNYSLSGCSPETRKSRLVHESGHVIRNGHIALFNDFVSKAYNKDVGCYKLVSGYNPPYFINTYDTSYAASHHQSISADNESFAEFVSLYVVPQGQYPQKCPIANDWVRTNIYNNYQF